MKEDKWVWGEETSSVLNTVIYLREIQTEMPGMC